MRDRFEVILNAIKTGVPITDPRSRFEEVINALVGAGGGGSEVEVTAYINDGIEIAKITVDDVETSIKQQRVGLVQINETTDKLNYNSPVTVPLTQVKPDSILTFEVTASTGRNARFMSMPFREFVRAAAASSGVEMGSAGQSDIWYQIAPTIAEDSSTLTLTVTNCSSAAPDIDMISVVI